MAKAKKNPLSLSEDMAVLVGEVEIGNIPAKGPLYQRLMDWHTRTEALENGEALAEAKGQITALEAEKEALRLQNEALQSEKAVLQADNADFQAILEKANGEIARIRQEKKEAKQKKPTELPEVAMRILLEFVNRPRGVSMGVLTHALALNEIVIRHHLDAMQDALLIIRTTDSDGFNLWQIIKGGRALLVESGKI
jgi:hypothetical protein